MQNIYDHSFVSCPSTMPSNRNNNNALKDLYHAQTTENELIKDAPDGIDFETMGSE